MLSVYISENIINCLDPAGFVFLIWSSEREDERTNKINLFQPNFHFHFSKKVIRLKMSFQCHQSSYLDHSDQKPAKLFWFHSILVSISIQLAYSGFSKPGWRVMFVCQ